MDYSFLWSAVAFIGGTLNLTNKSVSEQYDVEILNSSIDGNHYKYTVNIDGSEFHINYSMDNNNVVAGSLIITDKQNELESKLSVQKIDERIKLYYSAHGYVELSIINNSSMVAIYIENNKKIRVESISISEPNPFDAKECGYISVTSAYTSPISANDRKLHMELFLTSGAIDNEYTLVPDVVTFTSSKIAMTIFSDIHRQIICTDVYPKRIGADGSIDVINSDYKQHYSYSRENELIAIEEIVASRKGNDTKKREYTYTEDLNVITILETGKQFNVVTKDNDVEFIQIKK